VAEAILMVVGGVLYTVGAIVLARRRPDPSPTTFGYHEVWHAFMVTAASCHYAMILLLLRSS
jgi:hemolysin III